MSTNIGNLAVTLALDAVAFTAGLDKSNGALGKFAAGVGKTFAVISGAEAVFGGMAAPFAWVMEGVNDLEALGRQSRELGIDVSRLSGLQFAAGRASGDMEGALKHLNVKLNEVAAGSKQARDEFAQFGLDGIALSRGGLSNAVDAIANRMRDLGVDGGNASLAMTLMGREAKGIIPFLEKGSAAIREMEMAGGKLGAIATQDEVDRATRAAQAMDQLGGALKGIQRDLAAGLAPIITSIATGFEDWLKGIDIKQKIKDGVDWLEQQIPNMIDGLAEMFKWFDRMGHKLDELGKQAEDVARTISHPGEYDELSGRFALAAADREAADKMGDAAIDAIAAGFKDKFSAAIAAAKVPLGDGPGGVTAPPGDLRPTHEMLMNLMQTSTAGLNIFDQYTSKIEKLKEAFKGVADPGGRFRDMVSDLNEELAKSTAGKLNEYLNQGASAMDKLKAKYEEMVGVSLDKINPDAFAANMVKEFKGLGLHHDLRTSGAMEEGSHEAYSAILKDEMLRDPAQGGGPW